METMREKKHTPGPWQARRVPMKDGISEHYAIETAPGNGEGALRLGGGPCLQVEANARLIASAPELLEALEALVGTDGDLFNDKAHAKARAAIRRARGE